jgi:hypothetical protein
MWQYTHSKLAARGWDETVVRASAEDSHFEEAKKALSLPSKAQILKFAVYQDNNDTAGKGTGYIDVDVNKGCDLLLRV